MSNDIQNIVIIKKKKISGGHGHHGGAWKVAYADFVTAMMAFFLLMWLLNSTSSAQKAGIANYFSPTLSITSRAAGASGLLEGGDTVQAPKNNLSKEEIESVGETGGVNFSEIIPEEATINNVAKESEDNFTSKSDSTEKINKDSIASRTGDPVEGLSRKEGDAVQAVLYEDEQAQFESSAAALKAAIEAVPELKKLEESIKVDYTEEGMRIQIIDRDDYSMFPSGSAKMKEESKALLTMISEIVKSMPNPIIVAGHTDSKPFKGNDGYDNWDLSSDRANECRRILMAAGVPVSRIDKVSGKADTEPFDPQNKDSPADKRISIVLKRMNSPPDGRGPNR